jgi:hypothetical protein
MISKSRDHFEVIRIFAIDTSIVNFQTCPRHRDNLGVYWKRWKRTYRSPSHPSLLRVMQNVQEIFDIM